ncbi:MAG: hypothetical protein ACKOQ5_07875 [Solirubrobacterales bacterium]
MTELVVPEEPILPDPASPSVPDDGASDPSVDGAADPDSGGDLNRRAREGRARDPKQMTRMAILEYLLGR